MASRPTTPFRRVLAARALAAVLGLLGLQAGPAPAQTPTQAIVGDSAGGKGAQVYCFMRGAGNNHEVSWVAAYALIKRQSASLFRTSPEHAAVMITEAVVQNPGNYPDCGRYLGSLFEKSATPPTTSGSSGDSPSPTPITRTSGPATSGARQANRYSY
ncbi:DUF6554 family protein [Cyanobium sp. Morenito 9A2]|uniref:DUF6554 family protein n=1 Tax=Cyanobium sp. Morenito 9A2 TaxID=2823718 RepID=UPI0020CD0603|nr:DUF6554 family protein [Cyanobium sp. Morenito 9A2]